MAYQINKQRDGHYMMYVMQMEPDKVPGLERNLRMLESVMRFMTIRTDED
jgi:small subunit ribosomal protein S6